MSRKVVQDTIERAEAMEGVEGETVPPTTRLPQEVAEPDDFYGRTREIITFAEPGNITDVTDLPYCREAKLGPLGDLQVGDVLQAGDHLE